MAVTLSARSNGRLGGTGCGGVSVGSRLKTFSFEPGFRAAGFMVVSLLVQGASAPLTAFETDQYLALDVPIEDSAPQVNAYLNDELEAFLERRPVDRLTCRQVPIRFYRHLFQGLLASRLQKFLKADPEIDLFPHDLTYWEHLRKSIYRKPAFPFWLPLSPTIRIGEVRFGLDKFGHLFGFGRRYYKRYTRQRNRGIPEAVALRSVISRGLQVERLFVGGGADGVFSYSDLEANYQGMRLARDFCEGERPIIERVGARWRVAHRLDLRPYVTPSFDESYNNNHYLWPRWKKVRPILIDEHCARFFAPAVQARMRRYEVLDPPNPSKQIIEEYFERRGRDRQRRQSMQAICKPGVDAKTAAATSR